MRRHRGGIRAVEAYHPEDRPPTGRCDVAEDIRGHGLRGKPAEVRERAFGGPLRWRQTALYIPSRPPRRISWPRGLHGPQSAPDKVLSATQAPRLRRPATATSLGRLALRNAALQRGVARRRRGPKGRLSRPVNSGSPAGARRVSPHQIRRARAAARSRARSPGDLSIPPRPGWRRKRVRRAGSPGAGPDGLVHHNMPRRPPPTWQHRISAGVSNCGPRTPA